MGNVGPADQFGHNLDIGMRDYLAPVGGAQDVPKCRGKLLGRDGTATDCDHLEAEPELQRDLIGVFGQNVERGGAYIAEADNPEIHFLHIGIG